MYNPRESWLPPVMSVLCRPTANRMTFDVIICNKLLDIPNKHYIPKVTIMSDYDLLYSAVSRGQRNILYKQNIKIEIVPWQYSEQAKADPINKCVRMAVNTCQPQCGMLD